MNLSASNRKLFCHTPLIALWYGDLPEDGRIIFQFIVEQFQRRFRDALLCPYNGGLASIRCVLLWVEVDLDALAKILGIHCHRGYNGCLFCYARGEHTNTGVKYPLTEHPVRRSHRLVHVQRLLQDDNSLPLQNKSVFENLEYWDIVESWTIDFTHLGFLNVGPHHFDLLYSKTPRGHEPAEYNIRSAQEDMNKFLADEVVLPHDFGRPVNDLENCSNWKAEQWKSFYLYLILPCVHPHLPLEYYVHLEKLVKFMWIVISDGDDPLTRHSQLIYAEKLVRDYVFNFPRLFGNEKAYFSVHYLLHLPHDVRKFGMIFVSLFSGLLLILFRFSFESLDVFV